MYLKTTTKKWNASQVFSSEPSTLHIPSRWVELKNNKKTNHRLHYVVQRLLKHGALVLWKSVFWGISKHLHCLQKGKEFVSACVWNDLYLHQFFFLKATFFFFFAARRNVLLPSLKKLVENRFPFFASFEGIFP